MGQLAGRDLSDTYCVVLSGTSWHSGVIGIVASKVVERTGRPAILIALNEETGAGRGSGRDHAGVGRPEGRSEPVVCRRRSRLASRSWPPAAAMIYRIIYSRRAEAEIREAMEW